MERKTALVTETETIPEDIASAMREMQESKREEFNSLVYSITAPNNPILTTPTIAWDFNNPREDINQFSLNLVATLSYHNVAAIAANQIGFPYSIFALRAELPYVCINPKIVWGSEETIQMEEASIVLPGMVAKINRYKHIKMRFFTPSGHAVTKTFTGLTARVCQQMIEQLEGKLFIDGIGRLRMEKAFKAAEKFGKNYRNLGLMNRAISE